MQGRLRFLKAATALLYFGALLAGLMGQGWGMVLAFLAVFLAWSMILRPQLWPSRPADLAQSQALVALAALIVTQALLVVLCFGIGRGIGGVMGLQPALPDYLPLALSFVAVPLSRLIWNPAVMEKTAGFDPVQGMMLPPIDTVVGMVAQVIALPDHVTEAEVQPLLDAIAGKSDALAVRQALNAAQAKRRLTRAGRLLLILHATDAQVCTQLRGSRYPALAFAAAGQDADLLQVFARRCAEVLMVAPELAADCPKPEQVTRAARASGNAAMQRLAGLLSGGLAP